MHKTFRECSFESLKFSEDSTFKKSRLSDLDLRNKKCLFHITPDKLRMEISESNNTHISKLKHKIHFFFVTTAAGNTPKRIQFGLKFAARVSQHNIVNLMNRIYWYNDSDFNKGFIQWLITDDYIFHKIALQSLKFMDFLKLINLEFLYN